MILQETSIDRLMRDPLKAGREYRMIEERIGFAKILKRQEIRENDLDDLAKIGRFATLNYDNSQWEQFRIGMNVY